MTNRRTRKPLGLLLLVAAAVCFSCSSTFAGRWEDERTVGPFSCYADFSLQQHQLLLEDIAGQQHELAQLLGVSKPRNRIQLYLFHDKRTYQLYVRHFFPNAPQRRAMFVKRRGQCMVFAYRSDEFDVDLRHECTHALLHSSLPFVPLWLDEGLAEYFELQRNERAHDNPYLRQIKLRNWLGGGPQVEKLEDIRRLAEMGSSDYRDAWAWVHFMLHGSGAAHTELVRYLADIAAQMPPGRLSVRLRRRFPDLDQRFSQHFKTWKR